MSREGSSGGSNEARSTTQSASWDVRRVDAPAPHGSEPSRDRPAASGSPAGRKAGDAALTDLELATRRARRDQMVVHGTLNSAARSGTSVEAGGGVASEGYERTIKGILMQLKHADTFLSAADADSDSSPALIPSPPDVDNTCSVAFASLTAFVRRVAEVKTARQLAVRASDAARQELDEACRVIQEQKEHIEELETQHREKVLHLQQQLESTQQRNEVLVLATNQWHAQMQEVCICACLCVHACATVARHLQAEEVIPSIACVSTEE